MAKNNNKLPRKTKIDPVIDKYIKDIDIKIADEKRKPEMGIMPEAMKPPISDPETDEELYPYAEVINPTVFCPPGFHWEPDGYVPGDCIETV